MDIKELKIDILKQEIEIVQQKINHFDDLRHRTKQMAVTLWLAAVGVGLTINLQLLLIIAAFVPFPFWVFESVYHKYQEGWSARSTAIQSFIRTGKYKVRGVKDVSLEECLNSPDFGEFPVPDHYAKNTLSKKDHRKRTNVLCNFVKIKKVIFYFPLVIIALLLALVI
ncbi:MAG: hypothetical protein A7316_10925 [Candidatus Altiarchaeales archaeon WOR_SM1_86-2]|nr:MAG: hypothetical protein A7316_10925 [Candidatus Altiarchaeales archaeon WOR_SM1_86-2]